MHSERTSASAFNGKQEIGFPVPSVSKHRYAQSLRIAYVGPAHGTSLHRAHALERLGHIVTIVDPRTWLGRSRWTSRWIQHAGAVGIADLVGRQLVTAILVSQPDLVWVNDGYLLSKWVIERFKQSGVAVIGYSADNPFTKGHYLKWRRLFKALPSYDAYITTFSDAQDRLLNHGAKNVVRCFLSADEDAHKPRQISNSDIEQYGSKVSYIAQWAPERGPFLKKLLELGVPLSLWGDRWQKAKEWPLLKSVWRGPGIYDSEGYAKVIQCSKISLCLLYKNANNLHTSRTIEIPAIGSVLCAERSQEHLALYDEGYEAVFWSNAEECAAQCNRLLADEVLRGEIAQRGHERARRNNLFNEPVMARILDLTLTKTRRATP